MSDKYDFKKLENDIINIRDNMCEKQHEAL